MLLIFYFLSIIIAAVGVISYTYTQNQSYNKDVSASDIFVMSAMILIPFFNSIVAVVSLIGGFFFLLEKADQIVIFKGKFK